MEMWVGTVLFGTLCQVSVVWFLKDKAGYSIGLWLGIVAALITILHLSISLDKALDLGEGGAKKHMVIQNLVRYFVLIIFSLYETILNLQTVNVMKQTTLITLLKMII